MKPIYHLDHIAFYVEDHLVEGDIIKVSEVTLLDGTHPLEGEPVRCSNCGQRFTESPRITE